MLTRVGCSAILRFAGVVAALWLCGIGTARAGDGGNDTGVQSVLDNVCTEIGVASCPHLPTITQAILEMSGLENAAPDFVRGPHGEFAVQGFFPLCSVSAGTSSCSQANAVNAVNPAAASPVAVSDLPNLAALAFKSGKGLAVPVPLGTSGANSFFYAVATPDRNGAIKTLTVFFDYPAAAKPSLGFPTGGVFAELSLPLALLSGGTERPICGATGCPASLATLRIGFCAACVGGFSANVVGDFAKPGTIGTRSAAALGIGVAVSFAPSPNSASSHLILKVQVPLLVTAATDPAYFGVVPAGVIPVNQISGLPTAFTSNLVPRAKIGVTPQAAPACSGGACPATAFATTFSFCASVRGNGFGSGPLTGPFRSAVATFLSVGTDATTYVSSPVPSLVGPTLKCPF